MRGVFGRLLPLSLLLAACSGGAPDIVVEEAWAAASAPGQRTGAAYLTIANRGDGADRLLAVTSDAAASASLHRSSMEGGIARMRPIADGIAVEAGDRAILRPGGAHVMLTGLERPLGAGEMIALRLRFERSGERQVTAAIRAAGAPVHSGH